jgi:hypothetical protein
VLAAAYGQVEAAAVAVIANLTEQHAPVPPARRHPTNARPIALINEQAVNLASSRRALTCVRG